MTIQAFQASVVPVLLVCQYSVRGWLPSLTVSLQMAKHPQEYRRLRSVTAFLSRNRVTQVGHFNHPHCGMD